MTSQVAWWCNGCEVGWHSPDTRTGRKCWWCNKVNGTVPVNGKGYKNPVRNNRENRVETVQEAWERIMNGQ